MANTNKATTATTAPANTPTKAKAAPKLNKTHSSRSLVGLPQQKMLSSIASISKHHQGKGNRIKRFHQYKVGQTLLQLNQSNSGLSSLDVLYYAVHTGTNGKPLMVLKPCSNTQYTAFKKAWHAAKQAGTALPSKA